jgi:hypothetical protein
LGISRDFRLDVASGYPLTPRLLYFGSTARSLVSRRADAIMGLLLFFFLPSAHEALYSVQLYIYIPKPYLNIGIDPTILITHEIDFTNTYNGSMFLDLPR